MEFIDKRKKMHTNTKHPTFPIIISSMFVMQTLYRVMLDTDEDSRRPLDQAPSVSSSRQKVSGQVCSRKR
jgi:hypothetical protein